MSVTLRVLPLKFNYQGFSVSPSISFKRTYLIPFTMLVLDELSKVKLGKERLNVENVHCFTISIMIIDPLTVNIDVSAIVVNYIQTYSQVSTIK